MPNGIIISTDTTNFVNHAENFIRFKSGNYAILIDEDPLTDLMTLPYIKIALATEDGQIISTLNYYTKDTELIFNICCEYIKDIFQSIMKNGYGKKSAFEIYKPKYSF